MRAITTIYFNPRTYVRCDFGDWLTNKDRVVFQSTHLREVRPETLIMMDVATQFQSTHLREVRLGRVGNDAWGTFISIHAPT